MKKILLFGAIALSSLSFGQNVPSYVPTNGLVGWWPFNGNANDESGNGNHGTVNGATLTTDRNGVTNNAYSFDGTNNYIEVADNNSLDLTNSFTINCWMKISDYTPGPSLPNSSGNVDEIRTLIGKPRNSGWATCYSVGYSPNTNANIHIAAANMNCCPNLGVSGVSGTSLNFWTNYLIVYDGTSLSIYKNGILENTLSTTFTLDNSTQPLFFGKEFVSVGDNWYRWFKGQLDDIGIWNRALTQQEITDLYNAQTCTTPTATITPQSNTTFCQGGTVDLVASTGSGYTYEWYNNSSLINNAASSTYQATTSGNYIVKVIDGACDATSSATTVTVNQNPLVSFTLPSMLSNESSVYAFNASPTGGTYNGSGVSGTSFDPSTSGLGTVAITYDYTDNNNCSASKTTSTVVYDTTGIICTSYV